MKRSLERRGHTVFLCSLSPLVIQDIRRLARQLASNVARIREKTGSDRVDLVGVSQGGLLSLWYLSQLNGAQYVQRCIAVGTPFQGSWAAAAGIPLIGAFSRGIWQVLPNSPVIRKLARTSVPKETTLITIAMTGDPLAPPDRCSIEGATHVVLDGPKTPFTHQWMIFAPRTIDAIDAQLKREEA